tara:strand:- start:60352 stop:60606 length:255 start_codon:yes stop_codon:yes gene_type:complete
MGLAGSHGLKKRNHHSQGGDAEQDGVARKALLLPELRPRGLSAASLVRMKLFTLDLRLVIPKAGELHPEDASRVRKALDELFGS